MPICDGSDCVFESTVGEKHRAIHDWEVLEIQVWTNLKRAKEKTKEVKTDQYLENYSFSKSLMQYSRSLQGTDP